MKENKQIVLGAAVMGPISRQGCFFILNSKQNFQEIRLVLSNHWILYPVTQI